ncbi:Chloride channel protein [Labilithrix luteola]|uniref:Chloride channel protein n=1 Tax=Labilithrix luteola TaxID=1391654 RepID=A0A0K1QBW8_9BACT|nr:chloride channel protein [Labilithrix luteola]AKV03234.1 Chloride channel protein [Labilithrix luteola]
MNPEHERIPGATNDGLPVAPSMAPTLENLALPRHTAVVDRRVVFICALSIGIALLAGLVARLLGALIALVTNLAFHHRLSLEEVGPMGHGLGMGLVAIPVVGGVVVGLMARFGSKAIRGHGIPEAMEQVLFNESRIPIRMTFLKPLSAAIAIGTGGPFGAEGPIIATGGALGSVFGQLIHVTADERKTLLAAGAAAGMSATFGSPVAAVLLAVELLLFEFRPRSVIPVSLAAATATGVRAAFVGYAPVFPLPELLAPGGTALAVYIGVGAVVGVASVFVTRLVYWIEDAFEKLPIHWMWWPALGGIAIGVMGLVEPRTLGVGYSNIALTLQGQIVGKALVVLCVAKLVSWAIALGSGTSGGTLAPLFTIGGATGALLTAVVAWALPGHAIDPRIGALVGMAAMFAGASRALLTSAVFAFECTRQPIGLLPLLGGCASAYLISSLMMANSIMTEKLVRRGARVTSDYRTDYLDTLSVKDFATREVVTLEARTPLADVRAFFTSGAPSAEHQGYPVVEGDKVKGVVTRRDVLTSKEAGHITVGALVRRAPIAVRPEDSLRQAANHMVAAEVGRVVVLSETGKIVGILTRSDLLEAHAGRLRAERRRERVRSPLAPWRKSAPDADPVPM